MSNAIQSGVTEGVTYVASFEQLRMTDVESVGGKNASLGEMISQLAEAGVRVPGVRRALFGATNSSIH